MLNNHEKRITVANNFFRDVRVGDIMPNGYRYVEGEPREVQVGYSTFGVIISEDESQYVVHDLCWNPTDSADDMDGIYLAHGNYIPKGDGALNEALKVMKNK